MGKQRTPQGSRRRPPVRRAPSATAPTANGAAPEPEVQDLAEDVAEDSVETAAASEAIEAVTEAAPEKPEAALLETASPVALEAAAPAEPEPAPGPQAEDAPAEEPAAPEPVALAAEPEPEPEQLAVAEPAPVAEAVEAAAEPAEAPAPAAPQAPTAKAAFACRFNFTPTYLDVEGIGTILMNYVQNESAAALSHMRALGEVRSPADVIRLNVTEMQRAADASLTCWIAVARRASRSMAAH